MRLRITVILSIFFISMFVFDDADAQRRRRRRPPARSKYSKQLKKDRAIGKYRGSKSLNRGRQVSTGSFKPYQWAGIGVNSLNYFGDLAPVSTAASTDISFSRPGFGVMYGYRFSPAVSARIAFNWGRLLGDDFSADPNGAESAARYARNLSFRNDIKELTIGGEFYLIPNYNDASIRPAISPYIFLGVGGFIHEPQAFVPNQDFQLGTTETLAEAGTWVNLRELGTEGQNLPDSDISPYTNLQLAIPIAIGVNVKLFGNWNLGAEFGYRFIFTDYLDDVSGSYVNLDRFDDPLARILSDRSAETVNARTGEARVFTADNTIVPQVFPNGQTFNVSRFIGSGNDGVQRGNPDNNDLYFVTQIRLTYILNGRKRSAAKFR